MNDNLNTSPSCNGANHDNNHENIQDRIIEFNNLPFLNITSPVSNIPHLTNRDIDLHMPTDNNFGYYSMQDFNNRNDIIECKSNPKAFSALHCNIRSLSANFDCLLNMLHGLNLSFPLIGLSETKFLKDKDISSNVNIAGYDLISEPSLSNAGGVAFYIKNNYRYTIRSELTTSNPNLEALWIEILAEGQPNLICGIVYRHPYSKLDNFMDYMNTTIENIHQENKLCLIMGYFNIDLLKIDSH